MRSFPAKPALSSRPLLPVVLAAELARTFDVLSDPTRLRILHALVRSDEVCVSDLASGIGMSVQAVSNQLRRLLDRGYLESRRNGNSVLYRLADPCIASLLDQGLCLSEDSLGRRR